MKKIMFVTMFIVYSIGAWSQQSRVDIDEDRLYYQGKELYAQRKYAASLTCFEHYLTVVDHAQLGLIQDAEYYVASNSYALKQDRSQLLLETFIKNHPYTPYYSRVCFMLGRLRYEDKKYKNALPWYDNVKEKELDEKERREFLFTKGYSLLEMKNYSEAKGLFSSLKSENNEYSRIALYYFSYIEYVEKHNASALKGFLVLENDEEYSDVVPYYIVQIYYDDSNYEKALEHGRRMLQRNPTNPNNSEIFRIMGECAYREKIYKEAIEYLKKYESFVKRMQLNNMYMLGLSYYETNAYTYAVDYLSKATVSSDSIAQNAYLYLGHSYLQLNEKNKAKLAFESASKMNFDPKIKEEALYNYALASYETAAAFGESLSALERFIEEFPKSKYIDNVYDHIVVVFMSNKNYSSAYQSLLKMKTLTPRMKEVKEYVLFQLGSQAFAKSDYKNALEMFSASIDEFTLKSFSSQAFLWRGETYFRLKQYKEAHSDFQLFLSKPQVKSKESVGSAYYGIAYTYFSEKKYADASSWFLKYLKQTSLATNQIVYLDALNRLGDCYFHVRDFTTARKYYAQVIAQNSKGADYASFQNAFIFGLQKRYKEKINALEQMLQSMPHSEYRSNALYEIGRSYVLLEQNQKAIEVYKDVLQKYPKSPLARKASLEIGMLYFNLGQYDLSKSAYREVITNYKGSDEARTAFESLESLHVETNDVPAFLDYCKKLGKNYVASIPDSRGDSLSFIASEKVYIKGNYVEAVTNLTNYLQQYCSLATRSNCIAAHYYLADCYYKTLQFDKALAEYETLSSIEGNRYMEESLIRAAEITYSKKQFDTSIKFFKQLQAAAGSVENRNIARLGILRCSYFLNEHETTIAVANEMLESGVSDEILEREARYNRAKAYIALKRDSEAQTDLKRLSSDLRQESGAEAKYLFAQYLFDTGNLKGAENEVFDFIEKNTPHQFWLARSFVLLSDIYMAQNDDFQAKQYLLSLRDNYKAKDLIGEMIKDRLSKIELRQKATLQ